MLHLLYLYLSTTVTTDSEVNISNSLLLKFGIDQCAKNTEIIQLQKTWISTTVNLTFYFYLL